MNCTFCNSYNPPDNKFCTACGKPISVPNNKVCPNGHVFDSGFEKCPYCPSPQLQSKINKNIAGLTDTFDSSSGKGKDSTRIMSPESSGQKNSGKTIIISPDNENTLQNNSGRKLIGWLVSFSHKPEGEDFKLYEGRNLIGGDPKSDVYLSDPAVSSPHCMLLFRGGKIKIKDELSTNGTKVNGEVIEESELSDGDIILIGKTVLKFRSI